MPARFATVLNRLVPKLNQFKISPNESFATSIKMAISQKYNKNSYCQLIQFNMNYNPTFLP